MRSLILIAHNLRSAHNVGSLLRTAEGLGVDEVFLTGHTPYSSEENDTRLPHITRRLDKQIQKTALDAQDFLTWHHAEDIFPVLEELKQRGYTIAAIEQADTSVQLPDYHPPEKLALLVGREVEGVEPEVLAACDTILEIPMFGKKESFNVVQAAAMGLYHCRFMPVIQ